MPEQSSQEPDWKNNPDDWQINLSNASKFNINGTTINILPPALDDSENGHLYSVIEETMTGAPEMARVSITKHLSFENLTFYLIDLLRNK